MNDTECYVKDLFKSLLLTSPQQLGIHNIAEIFRIKIHYWEYTSAIAERKGKYNLFLNQGLSEQQQWQEFGHEMKHYCFDKGNQNHLMNSFIHYQEVKADYFAYHFCIPTFMLQQLGIVTAHEIASIFNVEQGFALKRLEMYKNNLIVAAESSLSY